jgi:aspartate/methionine/tyrosine aminotransferase
MTLLHDLRPEARLAPDSGISTIIDYGRGRPGLIPMWAGEGDMPTPDFISRAAIDGIEAGETFYTWQRGMPSLREALAAYHERHFGHPAQPDEFMVAGSGMHAIQMALQATVGAGDEAVYLSPAWPNFAAAAAIMGARPVPVELAFTEAGWAVDLDRLEAAIGPRTRVIFVNTPSNPTGWTADRATLAAILSLARRHGLWIIADEIYALFHYDGGRAASFIDVMQPEDRVLFVNSFSKNWAMTGWRVGWLRMHPSLQQTFENLVQYSNSGVPQFLQRGAIAALAEGDEFVAGQVARAAQAREMVCRILSATNRVRLVPPAGAFYLFFAVDGMPDARAAAVEIVDRANVGLAPGTAFGAGGDGWLRLCFHRRLDQVEEAAHRLADWIRSR